jgi:predicted MPP superfamily phosphohydrolase
MKKWLKRIGITVGALVLVVAVFLSYAYFVEPRRFVVVEEAIDVPNWDSRLDGLRVVTIADLHTGSNYAPPERIRFVVDQANAQNADIIVLLGDYVSEAKWDREALKGPEGTDRTELKVPVESIAAILGGLKAKYGVFAIIGNHDWYHNEAKIARLFREAGLTVLQNEIREVEVNGVTLRIWGIEDYWRSHTVPMAPYEALDEKANIIAITHNPDSLLHAPDKISVMFAGHTHGGQLNWPIIGPLAVFNDPRFMDGLAEVDGKLVYVSSGVGTSVLPLRFRVPPEINVVTLVAK